jgi:hypothetical protein
VVEVLRHEEVVAALDLDSTPEAIAHFKVWLLVTSAFVVSGPSVLELLGLTIATALLVHRLSAGSFWAVAITGHVAATVVAYAGVGVLWLATRKSVENVVDRPDYGVSAVWMAVLGALLITSIRAWRAGRATAFDRLVIVACLAAAVIGFVSFALLSGAEHLLAFVAGMLVAELVIRGRKRPELQTSDSVGC